MKRFSVCVTLVALMAVPAMAELTPLDSSWTSVADVPLEGSRTIPYGGGVNEVYDNLPVQVGGPGTVAFAWGIPTGAWVFDDIGLAFSYNFTHVHCLQQNTLTTPALQRTIIVGFFDNNSNNTHIGSPLLTTGGGAAAFLYTGLGAFTPGYAQFWSLSFPPVVPPADHHIWMGMVTMDGAAHWGNSGATPPGIGTSQGPVAAVGAATAYGFPTLISATGVPNTTGNLCWTIGFPEPASIALLAIGGVLALRRRR